MADDLGERTEAPTGRRLTEARQQGRVPKSTDLASAVDLIGGVILLAMLATGFVRAMVAVLRESLGETGSAILDVASIEPLLKFAGGRAIVAIAPILALLALIAYLAHALQVGFLFTTKPLEPKLDRLNFIAGLGRLFAKRNLVKTGVDGAKLSVCLCVAAVFIANNASKLVNLPVLEVNAGILLILNLAIKLAAWLLAVLLLLGVIDFFYQRWQYTQDMKMTKQEVQDERRSMEGDPQIKAKRFRMARDIALQRVNQAVPKADVVVTNPTHYSVALQYDAETMRAPRVVAKGVDHMAMRIRQVAMIHAVPMIERPPLARALYAGVEVGQEVPPEHYQAVAEILAYVYKLEEQAA